MPRMKILNSIEQEAFELPPLFNSAERKRHFDFPVAILQIYRNRLHHRYPQNGKKSLTRSANRHWSIPSIGTFRSTTSLPPTIACFNSWIGWNCRT